MFVSLASPYFIRFLRSYFAAKPAKSSHKALIKIQCVSNFRLYGATKHNTKWLFFFTFSDYFAFQLARQRNSTNNAPPIARHTHSLTRLAANNTKKWERSTRGSSLTAQIPWPTHTTLHLTACKRIAIVSTMLQHFRWIFALIYFTLVSVFNWWQNRNAALLAQPFLTWWIGWMDGRMEIKKKILTESNAIVVARCNVWQLVVRIPVVGLNV